MRAILASGSGCPVALGGEVDTVAVFGRLVWPIRAIVIVPHDGAPGTQAWLGRRWPAAPMATGPAILVAPSRQVTHYRRAVENVPVSRPGADPPHGNDVDEALLAAS